MKITKKKLAFLFLVKLCVDTRTCGKFKMLCDDVDTESNEQMKNFLKESCPNTCGYCSKLILDRTAVVVVVVTLLLF